MKVYRCNKCRVEMEGTSEGWTRLALSYWVGRAPLEFDLCPSCTGELLGDLIYEA